MSEIRMARPEDYTKALAAHRAGRLGVNWGINGAVGTSHFAESMGWKLPVFFGYKRAFIAEMLRSEENFVKALISSGIDVYIPAEQTSTS